MAALNFPAEVWEADSLLLSQQPLDSKGGANVAYCTRLQKRLVLAQRVLEIALKGKNNAQNWANITFRQNNVSVQIFICGQTTNVRLGVPSQTNGPCHPKACLQMLWVMSRWAKAILDLPNNQMSKN